MMPTAIGVVILLVATVAAILAGMAVFTNVRPEKPDDPRIGLIYDSVEETRGMVNQIQKSLLTMEHKAEKDNKDTKTELKDALDKILMILDKLSQEQSQ
jgi:hypothetical protein